MKIKHIDGSETDLTKENDIDAYVYTKISEFVNAMCKYKIPFYLGVEMTKGFCGGRNFNANRETFLKMLGYINKEILQPAGFALVQIVDSNEGEEWKKSE